MHRALVIVTLACLSTSAVAAPDYTKDPVVMVHGYFLGQVGTWTWLSERLKDEGWPEEYLYTFQFKNVFGCNPEHGYELKAVVDKALAETGRERVDILCHSMGCVDARYYIKFLCGYERVRDLVSIAGAHKGSTLGCIEPFSCGAEAMCVGPQEGAWMNNEFLFELNWCDITPGKAVKYTSIWSTLDEIIIPQENSIIEGAVNIKLQALAEHALILANQETATHVINGLDGGGTNNNLPVAAPPCVTLCELPDEPLPDPIPDVVDAPPEWVEPVADVMATEDTYEVIDQLEEGPEVHADWGSTPDLGVSEPDKTGDPPSPVNTDSTILSDSATPAVDPPRHRLNATSSGCQQGRGPDGTGLATLFVLVMALVATRLVRQLLD